MKNGIFGFALVVLLLVISAGKCHALREGYLVTKATQKEHGLNYALRAEKVGDIVMVSLDIPRAGKLKELESVALELSTAGRVPLHAPLAMTEKQGISTVRFQIGTEHVENCTIMLFLKMRGRSGEFYGVRLKDYVTERNAP